MNTPELSYNAKRYRALRSMGRCVACGKPSKEKTRCPDCMKKLSTASIVSQRKLNAKRKNEMEYLRARVKELEAANVDQ